MSKSLFISLTTATCLLSVACIQGMKGDVFTLNTQNRAVFSQKTAAVESRITRDNTAAWKWRAKMLTGGETLISQQLINATNARIVSEEGTIYETNDGGERWRQIKIKRPLDSTVTSVFFSNTSTGWASATRTPLDVLDIKGLESWILYTSDGGLTWSVQYSSKASQIKRVLFINDQEGWAIGSRLARRETLQHDYFVLHTTDQGKHWNDVSGELNPDMDGGHVEDVYAVKPFAAMLLTSSRKIFSTTDGGQRWEQVGAIQGEPPQTSMMHLGLFRNQHLWVLGGTGGREGTWAMLAQRNENNLWIKYRADGVILRDALFLSDTQVIACGIMATDDTLPLFDDEDREGVILYSSDGGRNWSIIYRNREVKSINALATVDSTHIWAVGDDGLVVRLEPSTINVGVARK